MLNLPGKLSLPYTKYAVLAAFVSWLYLHISQVLQAQVATDQKVVGLLTTLEIIYSFVNVIETDVSNKIRVLEDIIKKIFYQAVECVIFIREYTSHGFSGMDTSSTTMAWSFTNFFQRELVEGCS